MKKDDTKLLKLAERLLALTATEAYAKGEGFEFMMVEQDIRDCLDLMPLPHHLKQVRGAIYQSKGRDDARRAALWQVTNRASLSPKLSEDVAWYIVNCTDDERIRQNLQQRVELPKRGRTEATKQADP